MLRISQCLINLKSQLKKLHVILACDEDHEKVFPDPPIIDSDNNRNSKLYLMRDAPSNINQVGGKRATCLLCSNIKNTSTFKSKHSSEVYQITKNFNFDSEMVVHLIECRVCGKQYYNSCRA